MVAKLMAAPFEKIGARAKAFVVPRLRDDRLVRLDIRHDARGPYYELLVLPHVSLRAVDVRPDMRHLLLLAVDHLKNEKHKFLCGHDERHWFVAGVPAGAGGRGAADVRGAMEALKPKGVRWLQEQLSVKFGDRTSRRTAAYIRQGEWFFVKPTRFNKPWIDERTIVVRRDEPLSRGTGSKPHIAQFAFREGGEVVYFSSRYPRGLTGPEYDKVIRNRPQLKAERWTTARRNPNVFVRGTVRHPDHATIHLDGWHQVLMNEEGKSPAMRHIAFVD